MYESLLSTSKKADVPVDYPDSGPGPTLLIKGTPDIGYFGELTQTELFTAPELRTAVNLTAGNANTWTGKWVKMFSRGKVIYFPDAALNNDMPWSALYLCGITSGRQSTDAANTLTPTIQRKVVTKGEHDYVVRLFHSAPSYLASIPATLSMSIADSRLDYSEWKEIICRIMIPDTPSWTGPRWSLYPLAALMSSTTASATANRWCWVTPDSVSGYATNYQHGVNNGYINAYRDNRTNLCWYPVLELVAP